MQPHVSPDLSLNAFNCPHCNAFANQEKSVLMRSRSRPNQHPENVGIGGFNVSVCVHCGKPAFWLVAKGATPPPVMIYPAIVDSPEPNSDLPSEIKVDFEEARQIERASPRAAAALLRLAIQKLCLVLGGNGKNINDDIALLVQNGMSKMIQQALDFVRVIGNEAVHPGVIDLNDNPDTVRQLFALVNVIAETQISQPKAVQALYDSLPADKRVAIQKRDTSS